MANHSRNNSVSRNEDPNPVLAEGRGEEGEEGGCPWEEVVTFSLLVD